MVLLGAGGASLAVTNYQALAQQQATQGPIPPIQRVRDNLYVIGSSDPNPGTWTGGNTGVFIAENGVVLVDTKFPGYGSRILEQVRSVTDKPVTTIINTHTHADHTGSNIEFPATVDFVAHENTKAHFMEETCRPVTNCQSFKGDNAKFLPKTTFKDKMSLFSGKDQIDLYYFGRGHTNGDTWIVFPSVRAMQTGDMFQRKNVPAVNAGDGGSVHEFAQTVAKAAATIQNVDTIITGHSNPLLTWPDFTTFVEFYQDFLSNAEKGLRSGKSVDAVAKAYTVPDRFKAKGFTSDNQALHEQRTKALVQLIADEMKKK